MQFSHLLLFTISRIPLNESHTMSEKTTTDKIVDIAIVGGLSLGATWILGKMLSPNESYVSSPNMKSLLILFGGGAIASFAAPTVKEFFNNKK